MNKETGILHNLKEGAFWVAEKSTFITVPIGLWFTGKALLAKQFFEATVLGTFVGVDLLMYQYFKNRRKNHPQSSFASLRQESLQSSQINYQDSEIGRYRLEKTSRIATTIQNSQAA